MKRHEMPFINREIERLRDNLDIPKREISLASLDATHVGPVEIVSSGKFLLR